MSRDCRPAHRCSGSLIAVAVSLLVGCGGGETVGSSRTPLRLQDLVVHVNSVPRSYFLSDRRGGFLTGTLIPGEPWNPGSWAVNGTPVIERMGIATGPTGDRADVLDSAAVRPDRVTGFRHDGLSLTLQPLESDEDGVHRILVQISRPGRGIAGLDVTPAPAYRRVEPGTDGVIRWKRKSPAAELNLIRVDTLCYVLVQTSGPLPEGSQSDIASRARDVTGARTARMERLLENTHLRLSDPGLTRAVAWMKLSIDALIHAGTETLAVAGLPWDGTFSGRENARALAILGLATGEYSVARAVARSLAGKQDTLPTHSTYGRIPDRIGPAGVKYGGADVAPWFVREVYEYITSSNDVALAGEIYPAVKRSLEGIQRKNTSRSNLFVHEPAEVAMSDGRFRGAGTGKVAAVELQLLWYFQQMIGSFLAEYVGDRAAAVAWQRGSEDTEREFDRAFVDTAHRRLYDHLGHGGRGVAVDRPNGLFALEILGSEIVQQSMLRNVTGSLLYPHGLGTLGSSETGFSPYVDGKSGTRLEAAVDGPVLTSLVSQATYALTRYDRQDLSSVVTRTLAARALSEGLIGTLPEMIEVLPRKGESLPRDGGHRASLTGMTEFLRSIYADHLGIHLDAPSGMIRTEPRLPADLSGAEFTVSLGGHHLLGSYRRTEKGGRMTLCAPDIPAPVRWGFAWMEENGNAWRGSVMLPPGREITLVFGPEEMMAFDGTSEIPCEGCNHIRGFSRRGDIEGLRLAVPGR